MTFEHANGARMRAGIKQALADAGPAGTTSYAIAFLLCETQRQVRRYLSGKPCIAVVANTKDRRLMRWFSVGFEQQAAEYTQACNAKASRKAMAADATVQAIIDAAVDGRTVDDIAQVLGISRASVCNSITKPVKDGLIAFAVWPGWQKAGGRPRRYWSAAQGAIQPPETPKRSRAKPPELHKRPGPKPKSGVVVRPARKAPVVAQLVGEAVVPAGLKVTVCPSGKDHRFTVKHAMPFFKAMQYGSYMRTGSAIERAYGGGA